MPTLIVSNRYRHSADIQRISINCFLIPPIALPLYIYAITIPRITYFLLTIINLLYGVVYPWITLKGTECMRRRNKFLEGMKIFIFKFT